MDVAPSAHAGVEQVNAIEHVPAHGDTTHDAHAQDERANAFFDATIAQVPLHPSTSCLTSTRLATVLTAVCKTVALDRPASSSGCGGGTVQPKPCFTPEFCRKQGANADSRRDSSALPRAAVGLLASQVPLLQCT